MMRKLADRLQSIPGTNSSVMGAGGFTVAEIIIALGIGSILLLAMVSLFASINRCYTTQNVAADVQQVTRVGIDIIRNRSWTMCPTCHLPTLTPRMKRPPPPMQFEP